MSTPDRACPDYPNDCMHPWAHARTYAEVKATQDPPPELERARAGHALMLEFAETANAAHRQTLAELHAAQAQLKRVEAAKRRLVVALIAVEPLLQTPFTDHPGLTPWTRSVKPALAALEATLSTPCPTCQVGPIRETTGLVCQTCGHDYGQDTPPAPKASP